ncbi:MAG: hypothetical protein LC734_01685 [Acidobacteria bacterium]|nr:hypothetical protein [Acidobacteriota bacterium]
MNFIKFILIALGLIFGFFLLSWVIGLVGSLLWYGVGIGLIAAVGYGGYRLFRKAEDKYVGPSTNAGYIDDRDFSLSWEEYDRKYLKK